MAEFVKLSSTDERGERRPIAAVSQDVIGLLESVTAPEKAQAVPYLRIWQIDPKTGLPVFHSDGVPSRPLTLQSVEPPKLDRSVASSRLGSNSFRERPPVSLQRVTVSWDNPRGLLLYREFQIEFTIHRPDSLFFDDEFDDQDSWGKLLIPGLVFGMEYGWSASSGVSNGLLNGEGFVDRTREPAVVVPAIQRVRFTVYNYTFQITQTNEFYVTVHCLEDGEFVLRNAFLEDNGKGDEPLPKHVRTGEPPQEAYNADGLRLVKALRERFQDKMAEGGKKRGKADRLVTFKEVADLLFAPVFERAFRSLGYSDVNLYFGLFNPQAGTTSKRYGSLSCDGDRSIGDFLLPASEVESVLGKIVQTGDQLIVYNLVIMFIRLISDPQVWARSGTAKDQHGSQVAQMPNVVLKTVYNKDRNGRGTAAVYVIDAKREHVRVNPTSAAGGRNDLRLDPKATREQIREKLDSLGIPMVSFRRGNSYVRDADFSVVADEQIKSIFVRRYLKPTRQDLQDPAKKNRIEYVDPRQLIYSSAITGDVTMIGNFAFDVFGTVWLDFDVHQWSGLYYVLKREDVIQPGDFSTKVTLVATGDDPLNTQGRQPDSQRL